MAFYKFLVPKLEINICVIRTYNQEISEFTGKNTEAYFNSATICLISEEDLNELGIKENTNVKISTSFGSVVLKAAKSPYSIKGTVFIPFGIWANLIVGGIFDSNNPDEHIRIKNIKGFIESTEENIIKYDEMIKLFK